MEKSGSGGRPKDDVWERVTRLPRKRVRCNYCGFKFAASGANRIKAHFNLIKDKGIRRCTDLSQLHNTDSSKATSEKQDHVDSQGLLKVHGSRNCSKLDERTLDSKTMWEGIKALQQVQIHSEEMHQDQRIEVGPFYVSVMVNELDLWLIQYVFEHASEISILFSTSRSYLCQSQLATLKPQMFLDSLVIDIFADILTDTERMKKSKPLNWYLPVMFSSAALNPNEGYFIDFFKRQNITKNYMSDDLEYCEKIFIPVYVEKNSCGHYYLYVIHVKNQEVEIWDSLCDQFMDKTERDKTTSKLLLAMDKLFENVMFTKFRRRKASNILLQPNGYDCGIFVINYMQQLDNYVRKKPLFQFHSDEERLKLALKFLKNDLNQEKETLYDKAVKKHDAQIEREEDNDLHGVKRKQVDTCKTIFEDVGSGAYMKLYDSDMRIKRNRVAWKTECVKGYKLPTTNLVGEEVRRHTQQIWEWIMNNEVSAIGIWGMGGVGKTALATHVHNKLLEEAADDFDHIIWVTVSQHDNSIYKLQKAIARSINLDISDESDVKRISGKLLQASERIKKCVLILDDVWDIIILEDEVGFPVSNDGIKLILTTRSWEVCQNMNCMNNIIHVEPLHFDYGWDLFRETLGIHQIQSSRVEFMAMEVTRLCGGLPVAIVTIARSMKGNEDISEWNHLVECLKGLDNRQHDLINRVFLVLKASYARLNSTMQKNFLCYALWNRNDFVDIYDEHYVRPFWEGYIDETKSLEMQYNESCAVFNKLKNNSLLANKYGDWTVHTLCRVMAINIAKETDEIMTKTDKNSIELPANEEWNENLEKAFLTSSSIWKILNGTSPKCSKLSTLLLNGNSCIEWIPDDFFCHMPTLKVLNLSWTGIEHLPNSVSHLECLRALLLSSCGRLTYVPSLVKLQQLLELDLSFTGINEAPFGLELLVNLRYLNLRGTYKLKMSSSVVSKMTKLWILLMNNIPKLMDAGIQDLKGLRKLEVLSVNFCDIKTFNVYVKSFLDKDCKLKKYCLSTSTGFVIDSLGSRLESSRRVGLSGIDLGNRYVILPNDMNELIIRECDHWTRTAYLCHALSFQTSHPPEIEKLHIIECNKLEYLGCNSGTCSFCLCIRLVQILSLKNLKDLKQIVPPYTPSFDRAFFSLTHLEIQNCSSMTIVMTLESLEQLQNLEIIHVEYCDSVTEILEGKNCSGNTCNPTITLPKLRYVTLRSLPELTSVFRGTMLCPSLQYFHAYDCVKLSGPPDIEIVEGHKLKMKIRRQDYCWYDGIEENEEEEDKEYVEEDEEYEEEEEEGEEEFFVENCD